MTRPDSGSTPRTEDEVIPVGTDADEQQDADAVLAEAAASADEEALADAGLSREGGDAGVRRPARRASLAHRLYNGEAGLDVVGHSRHTSTTTAVIL